MQLFHKAGFT